jgi:membrane-associated phospholipid phosphatase
MRLHLTHTHTFTALTIVIAIGVGVPVDASAQVLSSQPVAPTLATPSTIDGRSAFQNLFADTVADFRRLPSKETLTILAIGGAAAALVHTGDSRATRTLSGSRELGTVLGGGQFLGSATFQMAGAMATYALGRSTSNRKVTAIGADLFRAQIVAQTLTQSIKMSVGRTRPDGTSYSFPSGHTASAFATAAVLQRNLGWKAGVPAYGIAAYIAASRVQGQRHYLSDITFGAALGIVAGRAVTIGHGDARFAVSPAATLGGAGINFTLVGKR